MNRLRLPIAFAVVAAIFGAGAPAASAEVRWATPGGDANAACTSGDPCSLQRAVNNAADGDEVILRPGTYDVADTVEADTTVDIHGQEGQAVPRLVGSPALGTHTLEMSDGGSISRVYASASVTSMSAFSLDGVIADGVEAAATDGAYGIELRASLAGTVLRNSVARSSGTGAAIQVNDALAGSTTILGVTALGTGTSDGIVVKSTLSTTTVKNTIARGTHWDVEKKMTALAPVASYSSFRPAQSTGVMVGAGNISATPLFADEDAGNLRVMAGAPTIDAGAADALAGPRDARGAARVVGSAPDMGAYEFDPVDPPPGRGDGGGDSGSGGGDPPAGDSGGSTGSTGGSTDGESGNGPDRGDAPLPPESRPVLGATVTLGEVKGAPLVRLPGGDRFVPLAADSTVPVGAIVDARKGTVALTSVRDASGQTQTGTFWGGVFQVRQSRRDTVTELALTGGDFSDCRAPRGRRGKLTAAGAKGKRRLWGRDRGGRFRTRGRHGSATVRGTRWLTEDRCDGTLFKVTEGAIDVRDDRKRRTVRLKRGQSYVAAPAAKRRKR